MENETKRLLLPFTHGVNVVAVDYAIKIAGENSATLVAVALIPIINTRKGARLEHIQQSKDFLELFQRRALRYRAPFERYEVFTGDIIKSVCQISDEKHCDSVMLFTDGTALMSAAEVAGIRKGAVCSLYMVQLPPRRKNSAISLLRQLFPSRTSPSSYASNPELPSSPSEVVRVIKIEASH